MRGKYYCYFISVDLLIFASAMCFVSLIYFKYSSICIDINLLSVILYGKVDYYFLVILISFYAFRVLDLLRILINLI